MSNGRRSKIDPDLGDRVDCLGRNLAKLRSDIPKIVNDAVRDAVLRIMKDRKPRRQHIEVGYR
jgi:hypothetical protein